MVGPVLYTFGSQEQKEKYLPDILSSDTWWCQGFSEPNAGSDLASLRTRAEDKGDHYLLNGQKAWTTHGRFADKMFCLARTQETDRPQTGISFLLLDMDSPGVEVRRSEEHTSELQSRGHLVCRLLLEKKKII